MKVIIKKIIALFIVLVPALSIAQDKKTEYLNQSWLGYFNQTRLTDRSGIWLELQLRLNTPFANNPSLSIARIGYLYYLNDNTRLAAGYAYVTQYAQDEALPDVPEHRLWQQVQWFEKKNRLTLMQWVRLEERFRREVTNGELTSRYDFNYRVRYAMAFTIPLKGREVVAKTPFLFLNNELLVNFGSEVMNNYFDQNRFFIGVGYQFTRQLNAQAGYLNVFQQLPQNTTFRHIDAFRLFIFHNLDFRSNDN